MAEDYKTKVTVLENALQEKKEKFRVQEEKAFELIRSQEKINDRWKEEHRKTVMYFEQLILGLNKENKLLKEANADLRNQLKMGSREESKDRERRPSSKDRKR